jgi:anti-anti-sigma regulatory factor
VSYTLPRVHEVRARSEVQAFTVEGEIDSVVVLALQRRISAALDAGYRRIVIDLSPVSAPGGQTSLMLGGALRRLAGRAATLAIAAGPAADAARARAVRDRQDRVLSRSRCRDAGSDPASGRPPGGGLRDERGGPPQRASA